MSLVCIAPAQFVKSESEPGGGSRRKGRPHQCWADNVTTLGIRNWHQAYYGRNFEVKIRHNAQNFGRL